MYFSNTIIYIIKVKTLHAGAWKMDKFVNEIVFQAPQHESCSENTHSNRDWTPQARTWALTKEKYESGLRANTIHI